jgi:hypothetical protein
MPHSLRTGVSAHACGNAYRCSQRMMLRHSLSRSFGASGYLGASPLSLLTDFNSMG